jgi:hypothetical protein
MSQPVRADRKPTQAAKPSARTSFVDDAQKWKPGWQQEVLARRTGRVTDSAAGGGAEMPAVARERLEQAMSELTSELVELVAERAAELLTERQQQIRAAAEPLLTVDQLAQTLATTPEWVRRHQAELGAFRLSDGGGRNPIRFRESEVERFLAACRLRPPSRTSARGWRDDPDWALG